MTADIFRHGARLGRLTLGEGRTEWSGGDETVRLLVDAAGRDGVEIFSHMSIPGRRDLVRNRIAPADPSFPTAVFEMLRERGYRIVELHPEVDAEITRLAERIPPEHPVRRQLNELLPTMTYLEKTYILEKLRAALKDQGPKPAVLRRE